MVGSRRGWRRPLVLGVCDYRRSHISVETPLVEPHGAGQYPRVRESRPWSPFGRSQTAQTSSPRQPAVAARYDARSYLNVTPTRSDR